MRRNWLQCVSARGVLVDEAGVCAQAAAMWGVWYAFLSAPLAPALKEERQLQLGEPEPSAAQHAALGFGRSVLQTDAETGDYSGLASKPSFDEAHNPRTEVRTIVVGLFCSTHTRRGSECALCVERRRASTWMQLF